MARFVTHDNEWDIYVLCQMIRKHWTGVLAPFVQQYGAEAMDDAAAREDIERVFSLRNDNAHGEVTIDMVQRGLAAMSRLLALFASCTRPHVQLPLSEFQVMCQQAQADSQLMRGDIDRAIAIGTAKLAEWTNLVEAQWQGHR